MNDMIEGHPCMHACMHGDGGRMMINDGSLLGFWNYYVGRGIWSHGVWNFFFDEMVFGIWVQCERE